MAFKIKKSLKKNKDLNIKPEKNVLFVVGISIGTIILCIGLWYSLSTLLATESYYILNQDVSAKVLVSTDMLTKVETAKGTAPKNALSLVDVSSNNVYTKVPLQAGDVLSLSNTGLNISSSTGIPDSWSVTSFTIPRNQAVNGNITKGEYFDVIGINGSGAKYIATTVLALDIDSGVPNTTVENSKSTAGTGEELNILVGMPDKDIPLFQSAINSYEKIVLSISPKSINYDKRNTNDLQSVVQFSDNTVAPDLYEGTDNTFSVVKRDKDGRPILDSEETKKE